MYTISAFKLLLFINNALLIVLITPNLSESVNLFKQNICKNYSGVYTVSAFGLLLFINNALLIVLITLNLN